MPLLLRGTAAMCSFIQVITLPSGRSFSGDRCCTFVADDAVSRKLKKVGHRWRDVAHILQSYTRGVPESFCEEQMYNGWIRLHSVYNPRTWGAYVRNLLLQHREVHLLTEVRRSLAGSMKEDLRNRYTLYWRENFSFAWDWYLVLSLKEAWRPAGFL